MTFTKPTHDDARPMVHAHTTLDKELFDVVAIAIKGGARRILATGKTAANADAIVMMAVMRNGVETEFFKMVPHGSESEADETDDRPTLAENELHERGRVAWHCSDPDGGSPDVGISIGLGAGKMIWIGEISKDRHAHGGDDVAALGDDFGCWMMVYPDAVPLAKFANQQSAQDFAEILEIAMKAAPHD